MLHIVDDEVDIQSAIKWMAKSRKMKCATYSSGVEFLDIFQIPQTFEMETASKTQCQINFDPGGDCVLMDVRMPGLSGIATYDIIANKKLNKRLPVIFITGHGEIAMAVDAIKHGAFDFFEKPFDDKQLFERIEDALTFSRKEGEMAVVYRRLDKLTTREREILNLILVGKMNKVIADKLGISMRTVEVHRANILEKMEVKSAIELAGLIK